MRRTLRTVPVLGLLGLGALIAPGAAAAATFTVTTTNDNVNSGSLRWAINEAEAQPGNDTIEFDIAGLGPHTITLGGDLPAIGDPVTVDGYSETGANKATRTRTPPSRHDRHRRRGGVPRPGHRRRPDQDPRPRDPLRPERRASTSRATTTSITGNHIGTNVAGDAALPNGTYGLEVYREDNVIGGTRPADRNVIAGHEEAEVRIEGGSGHQVLGNRIGTNAAGTAGLGIATGVSSDVAGNVVSGNLISGEAVGVELTTSDNVVQGNLVGTNAAGTAAVPNTVGIHVVGGDDNLIGGTAAGEGNVVSGNTEDGVLLDPDATGNDLEGNVIGLNGDGNAPIPTRSPPAPASRSSPRPATRSAAGRPARAT